MTRIAVTGSKGQVATSLIERAGPRCEVVALGRPAFDLNDRAAIIAGLEAARPDVVVNAAAYTAVDKAEGEEADALRVNGEGAGHVAEAAARLGVLLKHLPRPTTSSMAHLIGPIVKTIRPPPQAPTAAPSLPAKRRSLSAAKTAPFCVPLGSTAHSGRISSARC